MKRLLPGVFALGAACALAADPAAPLSPIDVTLQPGESHEACMHLEAGDKRKWYFKASAPLDFNIHYHDGDKVSYPVKRDRMRGDGGTFAARVAQDYCWMWTTTGKTAARLEARIDP
jgi:hypothetical protein